MAEVPPHFYVGLKAPVEATPDLRVVAARDACRWRPGGWHGNGGACGRPWDDPIHLRPAREAPAAGTATG